MTQPIGPSPERDAFHKLCVEIWLDRENLLIFTDNHVNNFREQVS